MSINTIKINSNFVIIIINQFVAPKTRDKGGAGILSVTIIDFLTECRRVDIILGPSHKIHVI